MKKLSAPHKHFATFQNDENFKRIDHEEFTDEKLKEKTRLDESPGQAQSAAEMPLLRCLHSRKLDRENRGEYWRDTFLLLGKVLRRRLEMKHVDFPFNIVLTDKRAEHLPAYDCASCEDAQRHGQSSCNRDALRERVIAKLYLDRVAHQNRSE